MKLENVGKQIKILRENVKMTRKKLCSGLCSQSELVLIEKGEASADLILLAALLERLGKSAERLAYILTIEEYQQLLARDEIEEALRFGRLCEAKKAFLKYKRAYPPQKKCKKDEMKQRKDKKEQEQQEQEEKAEEDKILLMYEKKILGIIALEEYEREMKKQKNFAVGVSALQAADEKCESGAGKEKAWDKTKREKLENSAAHFKAAIQQTLSFKGLFNGELIRQLDAGEKLLAMFEIENIVLYLYVQMLQSQWQPGNSSEYIKLLTALYRYLEKNAQDDELRAQYLAKTGMLLGGLYLERGDYGACVKMHEEILPLNREYGTIVCVLPLLTQIITAYEKLHDTKKAKFYTVHKENFESLFRKFQLPPDCVGKLYYTCRQCQYFVEGRLIAAERRGKGLLQSELIEGIYQNPENLSRIETGKANSDRKKFYALMERLEIDKTRYNGNLFTDEYRVLELDQDIEKHLAKGQYEEVSHELYLLEKSVDMREKCNRQLVLGMKNREAFRNGKITLEEALKTARELLEMTYHLENMEADKTRYYRIPFRNEMYLFNQVCVLLRRAGKIEEAIEMQERMMRTYEAAVEKKKFHFKNIGLCETNVCKWLEMSDRLEEAEEVADTAIWERLEDGKIMFVYRLLATKFDVAEKKRKIEQCGREWLRQAYLFSVWCRDENDSKILGKAYRRKVWNIKDCCIKF